MSALEDEFEGWIKRMLLFTALQLVVLAGVYGVYKLWRDVSRAGSS